jgi:hypothetical protein
MKNFIIKKRKIFTIAITPTAIALALLQVAPRACAQEADYVNPDRPGIADGSKVIGLGRF